MHERRRIGTVLPVGLLIVASLGVSYSIGAMSSPRAFAASSGADCQPSAAPVVSADTALDNDIADQVGPGWIGGDAGYSTALPNGNEAFAFSDTLIGTAQSGGSASLTGLPSNSELVGPMTALTSDYGGTFTAPANLINDANGTSDEWQVAATYTASGKQLVFVNQFALNPGSFFDEYTGNSAIVTMTIPSTGSQLPVFSSITPIPTDATTQWGNAMVATSTYDYVYGNASSGMKLARIPVGKTLIPSDWRYWNGSSWVTGEAHALVIQTTNEFTGVSTSSSGGYMALSIPNNVFTDKSVFVSYACTPQGPWTAPVAIYTIPEVSSTGYKDEIAYMATVHPEIKSSSGLVASYSIDSTDGLSAVAANVHEYQPRFLLINPGSSGGGPTTTTSTTSTTTAPPSIPSEVQASSGTTKTVALSPTKAGDTLVLSASLYTGSTNRITGVTDSAGDKWKQVGTYAATAGHNSEGEMWYLPNAPAGITAVTATTGTSHLALGLEEFGGLGHAPSVATSLSGTPSASASSTTVSTYQAETSGSGVAVGFVAGHGSAESIAPSASGWINHGQVTTPSSPYASLVTGYALNATGAEAYGGSVVTPIYLAAGVAVFTPGS
jgi:hypothetical protein